MMTIHLSPGTCGETFCKREIFRGQLRDFQQTARFKYRNPHKSPQVRLRHKFCPDRKQKKIFIYIAEIGRIN